MQEKQADVSSFPGLGRSPGGGLGDPLQYSGLKNPTDRGALWTTVYGVANSLTRLKQLDSMHLIQVSDVWTENGTWEGEGNRFASREQSTSQVLVFFFLFFFFKPYHAACRIYQPGTELGPKALEAWVSTTLLSGKSHLCSAGVCRWPTASSTSPPLRWPSFCTHSSSFPIKGTLGSYFTHFKGYFAREESDSGWRHDLVIHRISWSLRPFWFGLRFYIYSNSLLKNQFLTFVTLLYVPEVIVFLLQCVKIAPSWFSRSIIIGTRSLK